MAYPSEEVVQTWLKALQGLNVHVKKCSDAIASIVTTSRCAWLPRAVQDTANRRKKE